MTTPERIVIQQLPSGVSGLDEVLGGGIPQYSFNVIAGPPGAGKTTLAQQVAFANATAERPALYFTVLGEPPIKMLRYQQQFSFFDTDRVGADVQFLNLSDEMLARDFTVVLDRLTAEVQRTDPSIVIVDSFRTVMRALDAQHAAEIDLQDFVQRLALRLTGWEATTFLLGEFREEEVQNPVFTVADGVIWLMNEIEGNAGMRKLRVSKVRGQAAQPGLHTMRITKDGIEVFPRLPAGTSTDAVAEDAPPPDDPIRHSTGIAALDAMMGGGIPAGDSVLVTGPTGSGKTTLGTQFVVEGVRAGESAVIAMFEEHPRSYIRRARSLGVDLEAMVAAGTLDILYLRTLDLSVDETLLSIRTRVERIGATRVVIDSLTGFETALAPGFRRDFRESFYRMMVSLTALGITILSTVEVAESGEFVRFSPHNISFLTDDIISLRYVELDGALQKMLTVVKMRGSDHSREFHAYDLTRTGLVVREAFDPPPHAPPGASDLGPTGVHEAQHPLTPSEVVVLELLLRRGETVEDDVVAATGLMRRQVRQALDRLLAVSYVRALDRDGRDVYAVAPPPFR